MSGCVRQGPGLAGKDQFWIGAGELVVRVPVPESSLTTALGDANADGSADRGSTPRTSTIDKQLAGWRRSRSEGCHRANRCAIRDRLLPFFYPDADLAITTGDWVAIEGTSGSGKSALLNVLGCLDRHTSALHAVRANLATGRFPDRGSSERGDRVAVLGSSAALRLGITSVAQMPALRIGDDVYLIIGILDSVARQQDLLGAVIIPEGTARSAYGITSPDLVVVETRIGATSLIARRTPLALRPDNPAALKISSPPEPKRFKDAVVNDLNTMFLLLGGVSLLVGAIGIANVTLVSVMERTGEIGLRRAIGATRGHIAAQFLLESTAMGFVGGVLGASLGTLVVVVVSATQGWTPVLDPATPLLAPIGGVLIGLLSGTYPALRAARLEPVVALRSGT